MEDRVLAEDHVPVAELRWYKNLQPVAVGEREALPLPELWRGRIVIQDGQIELAVQAGDQFPCLMIAVNAPQNMPLGDRDIVLDEIDGDSRLLIKAPIVCFHIGATEVFKYSGWSNDEDAVQRCLGDFHQLIPEVVFLLEVFFGMLDIPLPGSLKPVR